MDKTIESPRKPSRVPILVAAILVVAVLYFAKDVLVPFALASLLSFFLAPLASRLERFVGRVASVILVVGLACGVLGGITFLVAGQLTDLALMLPKYKQNITSKLEQFRGGALEKASEAVKEIGQDLESRQASRATEQAVRVAGGLPEKDGPVSVEVIQPKPTTLEMLAGAFGPLLGPLATAGMVIVLILFMLLERENLRDRLIRLTGRGRIQVTTQAMNEAGDRVSRYLLMQTLINTIHGVAVATGMFFLDVPNFLLWGLFSAVLRFIPYVGPWIAAAIPILLSLAVFDNWTTPLMVIG
jgi:predicted PurR-regulated permease PerM